MQTTNEIAQELAKHLKEADYTQEEVYEFLKSMVFVEIVIHYLTNENRVFKHIWDKYNPDIYPPPTLIQCSEEVLNYIKSNRAVMNYFKQRRNNANR